MHIKLNGKVRKSGDVAGQGSPLVGSSMVTSPVSGAWAPHEHNLIFWAAWGLPWVSQAYMQGDLWDSWCVRNSYGLWLCSCRHGRCNKCGLHWLCKFGWCRLWHRDTGSGRHLWHGCHSIWKSVSRFDTAFMQVSTHAAVDSTITGAYPVVSLG